MDDVDDLPDAPALPDPTDTHDGGRCLSALGLTEREAAVLAVVAAEGDTTATAVAAACGLSRPLVSQAMQVLEDIGLVERTRGQRPRPVHLVADPGPAVRLLLQRVAQEQAIASRRAERAGAFLSDRAEALARRPRPYLRRLGGGGPGANWELLRPTSTYAEVCGPGSTSVQFGAHLHPSGARRRLLVLGEPADQHRVRLEERGVQVRATSDLLPHLVVVDGARARVEIGTTERGGLAWTFDPAQVAALDRLFDLWWYEASASTRAGPDPHGRA